MTGGEEQVKALVEKFKTLIEANGTIQSMDEWGKRRLAYPIEDLTEGYYVFINFAAAAEFPAELDRIYKITDGRFKIHYHQKRQLGGGWHAEQGHTDGRLTADPELRHTPNNIRSPPLPSRWTAGFPREKTGRPILSTSSHGAARPNLSATISRRGPCGRGGAIQVRNWKDQQGNNRRTYEVVAEEISFGESKGTPTARAAPTSRQEHRRGRLPRGHERV
jgi:small subunit ribosomal protein S6